MATEKRHILVCNTGSSSLKVSLFDWESLERETTRQTNWHPRQDFDPGEHAAALARLLTDINRGTIAAVGHRVVHGGAAFREAVVITPEVKRTIAELAPLAPLHNPAALAVIDAAERALPGVPEVAAFDTAFHATMLPAASLYPVPYDWFTEWGIRRFGFHGLSHAYCAQRAAELLQRPLDALKLVTCHLGQGASLAAVAGGRSVMTTMGFTPLDGIMMGTRPGSLDPGILLYLLQSGKLDAPALENALNYQSGLKGVSGFSDDMRQILQARAEGNERAKLAFDLYVARLKAGVASMTAAMGGVDAIIFAGGVGEHAAEVRAVACAALGWLGVELDADVNTEAEPDCDVAASGSRVRVLVVHTREDLMVARETRQVLAATP